MKQIAYMFLVLVGATCSVFAQTPHLNTTSILLVDPGSGNQLTLNPGSLTGNRIFTFPDVSGGTMLTTANLASITSVGTITSGTWNGSLIGSNYGGTGLSNSDLTGHAGHILTVNGTEDGFLLTSGPAISGGTVDATPIGATTPSTGVFTTITSTSLVPLSSSTDVVVSNSGTLQTRSLSSLSGLVGISADAALTGDGTIGNPLGLNLTNANTWTGTQTFPSTAAQGDALIASTNSGTTTIDAARIGSGLTDAQVNDNLTINGGTMDATPVGATTESTGRFTTVEATTVLGAVSTPAAGTTYRDNAVIAWGDVAAAGIFNDQFGNAVVIHTPGTGVYTVALPNAPTAASTTVTLQSLGLVTVTRAGSTLTITTYDTTSTPTDLDFYYIIVGRP